MKRKKEIEKALHRVKTDACEKIEILYNADKSDFENNRKYRQEMVDMVDGLKASLIQYSAMLDVLEIGDFDGRLSEDVNADCNRLQDESKRYREALESIDYYLGGGRDDLALKIAKEALKKEEQ